MVDIEMRYQKNTRSGCRAFLRVLFVLFVSLWFKPSFAQSWPHWRFEPGNTGLNPTEALLFPPPDLFWFSANFGNNTGAFRTAASSPIVVELANDPENPGLSDPLVFIARRDNLYAYRPDLQGSFTAGAIQPATGWPLKLPGVIS